MPCRQYLRMKWYHLLYSNLTHTILHLPFCSWGSSTDNLPQHWDGSIQKGLQTLPHALKKTKQKKTYCQYKCISSYSTEPLANYHFFHSRDYWNGKKKSAFPSNDCSHVLTLWAANSDKPQSQPVLWEPFYFNCWRKETSLIFQVFSVVLKRIITNMLRGKQE